MSYAVAHWANELDRICRKPVHVPSGTDEILLLGCEALHAGIWSVALRMRRSSQCETETYGQQSAAQNFMGGAEGGEHPSREIASYHKIMDGVGGGLVGRLVWARVWRWTWASINRRGRLRSV